MKTFHPLILVVCAAFIVGHYAQTMQAQDATIQLSVPIGDSSHVLNLEALLDNPELSSDQWALNEDGKNQTFPFKYIVIDMGEDAALFLEDNGVEVTNLSPIIPLYEGGYTDHFYLNPFNPIRHDMAINEALTTPKSYYEPGVIWTDLRLWLGSGLVIGSLLLFYFKVWLKSEVG